MDKLKLSILTPAVWSRKDKAFALHEKITQQAQALPSPNMVEHLVLFDDKKRTIGAKRQSLLEVARGEYIAFVDDDDDIAPNYVGTIVGAANAGADVIVFKQQATFNGATSIVDFNLRHQDEQFNPGGITRRSGWHVNAWRREMVKHCLFAESNYGEDLIWALQARALAKTQAQIDAVIHYYFHDEATTEAPPPQ